MSVKLFKHQEDALAEVMEQNRCAFYMDMG